MVKKGVVKTDNSFGVSGVVLGILSISSISLLGVLLGVVGLIFSLKQNKKGKNKWSKAGIILNIIGIVLGVLSLILIVYFGDYLLQLQSAGAGI